MRLNEYSEGWKDEFKKRVKDIKSKQGDDMASKVVPLTDEQREKAHEENHTDLKKHPSWSNAQLYKTQELIADKWQDILLPLTKEEYAELRSSIEERGILTPIVITSAREIVDGHHRYKAAMELGIDEVPCMKETFRDGDEIRAFIYSRQIGRRNIDTAQRDELIAALHNLRVKPTGRPKKVEKGGHFDPLSKGKTVDKVAKEAGVSPKTVKRAVKRVGLTDLIPHWKKEKTSAVLKADKAMKELCAQDRADLEQAAKKQQATPQQVIESVPVIEECGEVPAEALAMVMEGLADEALKEERARKAELAAARELPEQVEDIMDEVDYEELEEEPLTEQVIEDTTHDLLVNAQTRERAWKGALTDIRKHLGNLMLHWEGAGLQEQADELQGIFDRNDEYLSGHDIAL